MSVSTPAESSADSLPIPRRFSLFAVGGSLENEADLRLHHDAVLVALGVPMMLFFGVLNLALLYWRIREEERALKPLRGEVQFPDEPSV